ncbi:hypothetical protein ABZX51_007123 [Aspergillus tubingensis]
MKSNDGVFYGRNISDEDMDRAVWVLRGILIEMHSPSQIGEPLGGTAIFGTTRASTAEKRPGDPVDGGRHSKRIEEKEALKSLTAEEDEVISGETLTLQLLLMLIGTYQMVHYVDLEGGYDDEPIKLNLRKGRKGLQQALNLGTTEE